MNEVPTKISGVSKIKKFFFWTILFLIAVIIAGISRFEYWLSLPPDDVVQADKGFRKAKETINPEQLRVWALQEIEIKKYSVTNEDGVIPIPNSEIPAYIKELFGEPPAEACVAEYGGQKFVCFDWGGPVFDWSISIGSTNLLPRFSSEETTTKWVSGIYFGRYDR